MNRDISHKENIHLNHIVEKDEALDFFTNKIIERRKRSEYKQILVYTSLDNQELIEVIEKTVASSIKEYFKQPFAWEARGELVSNLVLFNDTESLRKHMKEKSSAFDCVIFDSSNFNYEETFPERKSPTELIEIDWNGYNQLLYKSYLGYF